MVNTSDPNVWSYAISMASGLVGAVGGICSGLLIAWYRARLSREDVAAERERRRRALLTGAQGEVKNLVSIWYGAVRSICEGEHVSPDKLVGIGTPTLDGAHQQFDLLDPDQAAGIVDILFRRDLIQQDVAQGKMPDVRLLDRFSDYAADIAEILSPDRTRHDRHS